MSTPYPRVPYPGQLSIDVDGRVRFAIRLGRIRQLILPAGGLRLVTTRAAHLDDQTHPSVAVDRTRLVVLVCEDGAGAIVQVMVHGSARHAAELFVGKTAGATGPPAVELRRSGSWLTGPALLVILSITAGPAVVSLVTGDWLTVWLVTAYAVAVLVILIVLRRRWTTRQERLVLDPPVHGPPASSGAGAGLAGPITQGPPLLGSGGLTYPMISEVAATRSRMEGRPVRGKRKAPPPTQASEIYGRAWWRVRYLRRRVLRTSVVGFGTAVLFTGLGAFIGVPVLQTRTALAAGPTAEAIARVELIESGSRLPLQPATAWVSFSSPDGPMRAKVVTLTPLTGTDTVPVEYSLASPERARVSDARDGIPRASVYALTLIAIGLLIAPFGLWLPLRHARRLVALAHASDPTPVRYVLLGEATGDTTALLFPVQPVDAEPVLAQPLAAFSHGALATCGTGLARGWKAGNAGGERVVLQIADVVLWPRGPAVAATPAETQAIVNGPWG